MDLCSWTRMLDVSGPTSLFIDEENDPQRNCLSQPKKKKKKSASHERPPWLS